MGSGLSGIGITGLLASQQGLAATGRNISNVNTEGYSRQSVDLSTLLPQETRYGQLGGGVNVDGVRRAVDQFAERQLTATLSASAGQDRLAGLLGQLSQALGGLDGSLSEGLDRFFSSLQDVANDPASAVTRRVLLDDARALANRFNEVDDGLEALRRTANDELGAELRTVNDLARQVADLNQRIENARGGGEEPNELLDERRNVVNRIAERIEVRTVDQQGSGISLAIGTGQALVIGSTVNELSLTTGGLDPGRPGVAVGSGAGTVDITAQLGGGRIGALLSFRDGALGDARAALGRIAVGMAETVNARNRLGLDGNGQLGGDLFRPLAADTPVIRPAAANTGGAVLDAEITDAGALRPSAYALERQGATITLTRLSDGTETDVSGALGTAPGAVTVDGVRIALSAGAIADGDRFRIEPVQAGAARFAAAAARPEAVAAAAPVRARTPTANAGNAAITPPEAGSTQNLPLGGPITLTFDAANNEFDVSGGPGGSLAFDPATDAGGRAYTLAGYGDLRFEISGVPADGDTFVLENNTGAVGDGANALALAQLREARVFGGATTLTGSFAETVGDIGARTSESERAAEIQSIRLDAARGRREAVSGVNLDEEAANLVRFQQSYQASARVISVADNVFQTLLRATGT